MNYQKIKDDVNKFKVIVASEGLVDYSIMGSLLLELCLKDKRINSTVILGYLAMFDTYWSLHCWNKIELDGEIKQIDIAPDPMSNLGFTAQYTVVLEGKWSVLTNNIGKNKDYYDLVNAYKVYKEMGAISALELVKSNISLELLNKSWKNVASKASKLETFESIEKYIFSNRSDILSINDSNKRETLNNTLIR
ncbi:hypothetical protein CONCODRAFT_20649 [Conidiobolus coronatus NRRL 28638]|uniref:Uncharacterized protein n=1 Tax=Conidiobolus coronatus (strain ATCC 28846 / CBS 209.66 / NRRL 28638) TaxID=796925 RepID=A0A137NS51_CONC2|nr:hypothetical protein CONCODRAFT_20649 [Conidiobolus coronatus NRRL 28638]|eukprot:KXN65593.1 hypothetical protein CONCODRAFT_20649 [Conidiobolus coronatus NRRL 28638]